MAAPFFQLHCSWQQSAPCEAVARGYQCSTQPAKHSLCQPHTQRQWNSLVLLWWQGLGAVLQAAHVAVGRIGWKLVCWLSQCTDSLTDSWCQAVQ